jgi:hypothetical protein
VAASPHLFSRGDNRGCREYRGTGTEAAREIVDLGIGPSEAEPSRSSFIKGLR